MIQSITFWTTIAATAIGTFISIITIIIDKKKNKSEKLVDLAKIVQKLPEFINEAEKIFGGGTGVAKVNYVLNKVQMNCIQNKIKYDENQFKGEIEKILATPQKKENV